MTVNFNVFFVSDEINCNTKMFNTFFAVSVFAFWQFLSISFLQLFRNIKGDLYSLKPWWST